LNSGGNIVPWNHPLVYVSLPLSLVLFLAFVYIEDRVASEPIIPVRLLLNQSVAAACLTNWFMTMYVFALSYYVPIFFRVVKGASTTHAGLLFIPQAVGVSFGSLGAGILMRWTGKYRVLHYVVHLLSLVATSLILGTFNAYIAEAPPYIYLLMVGTAYGAMLTITLLSLISAVDHKYQAVITSASYAFRSTGSSIGVTIASAVFQNLLKAFLFDNFGDEPDAAKQIRKIRNSPDAIDHLPLGWKVRVIDTYVDALRGVWIVVLGFAVLAATASVFVREHKLYSNLARK
jgi:predicted MFS family arabinose efflux permease